MVYAMLTIEPFDQYSARYEEWFEKNRYLYESEMRAIRHFISEAKDGKLVDPPIGAMPRQMLEPKITKYL